MGKVQFRILIIATLLLLCITLFSAIYSNNLELLPAFIGVFLNFFIGIFVFLKNWDKKVNQTFCLLTFCVGAWGLCLSLFQAFGGIAIARLTYTFASAIPAFFFAFTVFFPHQQNLIKVDRRVGYALALVFAVLSYTNLIIQGVVLSEWGITLELGSLYFLFAFYFLLGVGSSLINLMLKYKRSTAAGKMQIRYVFLGTFLSASIGALVAIILPLLGFSRLYFLALPATLIMIGFLAYTIVKHRLMDISVIVSRFVAEIFTVLFLGTIYLSLVWLHNVYISPTIGIVFLVFTILYGVLVGQIYQGIRLFIQTTSDKVFLRGKYNYYKELSEVTMRVGEKLSFVSILQTLYKTFDDVIEISNSRIFLPEHFSDPEKISKRYVVFGKEPLPQVKEEEILVDDSLVKKLISGRVPIHNLHDRNRVLIVPCLLEDRLIAIFVLGKKLSEDHYTDEDVRLLEVLASQAAMALDHSRTYEKIKSDLEAVETQLSRSQRLAALGTLTAGVTHEIRNPLTVIRSETERLANQERNLSDLEQYRDLVLKHVDRVAGIVQRMLSMAKEKPQKDKEIDLNEIIEASLQLVSTNGVKLKKDLELVPLIKGDPVELEEVFVNLMQNAIHAMPEGGTLTIKTYIDEGRAVAEVTDTGKGIPPEIKEKIFDPFFSTRHEGTGLGLSIAYRIIREHGGDIRITSEVGKGTTFKILF